MDVNLVIPYLVALNTIIAIGTAAYTFLTSGAKQTAADLTNHKKVVSEQLAAFDKKNAEHDRRIQAVEGELKHLPDKDMVTDLRLALAELKGNVGALTGEMGSIARTVRRIEDYLQERT